MDESYSEKNNNNNENGRTNGGTVLRCGNSVLRHIQWESNFQPEDKMRLSLENKMNENNNNNHHHQHSRLARREQQ